MSLLTPSLSYPLRDFGGIPPLVGRGGLSLINGGGDSPPPVPSEISFVGAQAVGFGASAAATFNLNIALTGGTDNTIIEGDLIYVFYAVGSANRWPVLSVTGDQGGAYTPRSKVDGSDNNDCTLQSFWLFAGAVPDTVLTMSPTGNASDKATVHVRVYRGVDAATPFDVADTTALSANTGLPDPPAITPVTPGAMIVAAGARGTTSTTLTAFTCANLDDFRSVHSLFSGGFHSALGSGHKANISSEFNPDVFAGPGSSTIDAAAAITSALRPAA